MLLKEIVYQIKNIKAGGVQSDDVKMSDDQYAAIIHYYRAKLIRQQIDRNMRLDPLLIQSMHDLEVERVVFNRGEPLSGKTVFRTIKKLPRAITTKGSNLVTFVGHNLLGDAFQRTTAYKTRFDIVRPYTGLNVKWFEFDERIYVITEDSLKHITVQLVAEDPSKVLELTNALDIFDPLEFEYPMSITLIDSVFKLIADAELKLSSLGTDDINDALDSKNANSLKQ